MKLKKHIRLHTTLLAVGAGGLGTEQLSALMCTNFLMSSNKCVAHRKKGAMLIDLILLTQNTSNYKNTKTETGLKLEGVWEYD